MARSIGGSPACSPFPSGTVSRQVHLSQSRAFPHSLIDSSPLLIYNTTNLCHGVGLSAQYGTQKGHKEDMVSESYPQQLRDALKHLYDPDRLRRSPLASLFGVADRFNTPSALRRILSDAIAALKPDSDAQFRSPSWRTYNLLHYRYVEQFSQKEVADQLGVSVRQLRRLQNVAVEALASYLWDQFGLPDRPGEGAHSGPAEVAAASDTHTLGEELGWLDGISPDNTTDLQQALPSVLSLARTLADQRKVRLTLEQSDNLPHVAVHPVAFRQMVLNLLTVAIAEVSCDQVAVRAYPLRSDVEIRVLGSAASSDTQPVSEQKAANLEMVQRLVSLCGGTFDLSADSQPFCATLRLPAVGQLSVLLVDDNADTLRLLERYASGTRYHIIGLQDPGQVLGQAEILCPQIIVLDVMMPQMDGWAVLELLRHHASTAHIPIIVCTILSQEKLALALGAAAFVRKPVTREAFLAALNAQIKRTAPADR